MNERVKKRFEEYAGHYKEAYLSALNTAREKKGERPLDPSNRQRELMEAYISAGGDDFCG